MENVQILNSLVNEYSKIDGVKAIVLGGSSATKADDNKSDFDIYIYSDNEPDIQIRKEIALKYSLNPEIDNHYFETGDVFVLKESGKPIDIMYRKPRDIEANIDWVWNKHNASMGYTTCFVDNVNKSKILFDPTGWFKKLQDSTKTPYPDELANNIIKKNYTYLKKAMFSYYDQIVSAVEREDCVSVNHRTAAFIASTFDTIFAINRILHPGEKRLVKFALENCKKLPDDFELNINRIATGSGSQRIKSAENIVESLSKLI